MIKQKVRKMEPIRRKVDIIRIKAMLSDQPKNLALFTTSINTNLRASDLLGLMVDQVQGIQPGFIVEIVEKNQKAKRTCDL